MHETTTATSIIQQEAGEDAEIIFGTVLDESFDEELRVTVIATGFELSNNKNEAKVAPNSGKADGSDQEDSAPPSAENITRRVNRNSPNFYKGEQNLKNLDTPAIHRRGTDNIRRIQKDDEEQEQNQEGNKDSGFGLNKKASGNRLLNNRRERIADKDNTDQPAFLRKIMD
jgi:cell division protein FtsZ